MHKKSGSRRFAAGWSSSVTIALGMAILATKPAWAQKGADWTSKLEPRTRAMQVCSLGALNAFGKDKKLRPRPDRVRVNAGSDPKIDGSLVSGAGGAVRSGGKWYAFTFKCTLNDTGTKTARFTYDLGKEIPKGQWERLGLWE